jgi:hypothetical protein
VLLSDITGLASMGAQSVRSQNSKKQSLTKRHPSFENEPTNRTRLKGYDSKNNRLKKEKHTLSGLFSNYQRFGEVKLEGEFMDRLRQEIINQQAETFKLMKIHQADDV